MVAWGGALDISSETLEQTKQEARKDNMDNFVLFIWIGVISGSSAWVYTSLFKITGYRQGSYWRKNYLEAVMRQDVAWFDLANPAELPTKITKRTSLKEKHRKKPRKAQQNRQRENPVDVLSELGLVFFVLLV